MITDSFKIATIANCLTIVISVVAAVILPVGYFGVSYLYLKGALETEAEINSKLLSKIISTNPELWRYETIRIEELLGRRPRSQAAETRRIFDDKNILVAESLNDIKSPLISASYLITDSGVDVGRIEISRSLLPIILQSGILAIFGLGFGLLFYRWLPFRDLIKAGSHLRDKNEFLKKVMEGSTNSLVVLDLAGNIQMFNGRFEALSGCSSAELIAYPFCNLFTGDAKIQIDAELRSVLTEQTDNTTFETVLARKDGLVLNIFCGAVPLLSEGFIDGIVVSLDDITDRINAEDERMALERHFQQTQKLESLGVLAGGIAHDFNNILAIILGYCYVIKDDIDPLSSNAEHVLKIENAANRASDLCRQMLSYAGKNELQQSLIEMNSLVDEMVKMLISGIKKNVTVKLDLCDSLMINGDNSQIQQIVMNLVINAAEAIGSTNGTINISLKNIEVQCEPPGTDFENNPIPAGRYACLEVSDDGCGMDIVTQNRIFEPFYTTKFAGRGLGMSATLGILKSHNGTLQLSSEPGVGTTFKIYLPLLPALVSLDSQTTTNQFLLRTERGTILLVDDEEELRVLGSIRLKKIGFTVIAATNGLEALKIFREQETWIDLILLDLLMPEMDGVETYHQLRNLSKTVPIVFCSGCNLKELSADILDDEHTGFLKKPYKPDQLRTVLQDMLGPDAIRFDSGAKIPASNIL